MSFAMVRLLRNTKILGSTGTALCAGDYWVLEILPYGRTGLH